MENFLVLVLDFCILICFEVTIIAVAQHFHHKQGSSTNLNRKISQDLQKRFLRTAYHAMWRLDQIRNFPATEICFFSSPVYAVALTEGPGPRRIRA